MLGSASTSLFDVLRVSTRWRMDRTSMISSADKGRPTTTIETNMPCGQNTVSFFHVYLIAMPMANIGPKKAYPCTHREALRDLGHRQTRGCYQLE